MTKLTSFNPYKEEDEGYLAAEAGRTQAENPHPRGTIRFEEWRRGWQIKRDEARKEENEGYHAAASGQPLSANPHPAGTIRYEEWRRAWNIKQEEIRRAIRLHRDEP